MSNVYELLLRHPALLTDRTTLIGAASDIPGEFRTLARAHRLNIQTWDLLTANAWRSFSDDSQVHFGMPDPDALRDRQVIMLWPKAKDFARALLQMLSAVTDHCHIVAANDAGGKSINSAVKGLATDCTKTDSARHCSLWNLTLPRTESPLNWLREARSVRVEDRDFMTLPGVFGHGKMDIGTALLLEHVPAPGHGSILDLGCGSGVIGLTMKGRNPKLDVTMTDVDAFALRSTQLNSTRLGMESTVMASDGLDQISGRFDIIFSNPPFHQGKRTDYDFARRLLMGAHKHLTRDGQLWIVANRHLAYEDWAKDAFGAVEVMVQANGFKLICMSQPIRTVNH